jgi:cleavage and polyadenylation specificity factor subunit 3
MFLEAQFGADNVAPIAKPRLANESGAVVAKSEGTEQSADDEFTPEEKEELARLHEAGIPVPGIEIRVDKMLAKVWLETLNVECGHAVLRDRVSKVVERAVECVSGLWV